MILIGMSSKLCDSEFLTSQTHSSYPFLCSSLLVTQSEIRLFWENVPSEFHSIPLEFHSFCGSAETGNEQVLVQISVDVEHEFLSSVVNLLGDNFDFPHWR